MGLPEAMELFPTIKKLSFCVTSCNRLWQLERTLISNLSVIDSTSSEIVIVDYGSNDGIRSHIWENFNDAIDLGALRFFEVTNPVSWNCPKAKNLAHRIARGEYLFNLDADNFVSKRDFGLIIDAASRKLPAWQFSGDINDGSYGRIGLPRDLFYELGGYDETLLPVGVQDTDLINRIDHHVGPDKLLLPPTTKQAIKNTRQQKIQSVADFSDEKSDDFLISMSELNLAMVRFKRRHFGNKIEKSFSTYSGYLNGQHILIDGFNRIYKLD